MKKIYNGKNISCNSGGAVYGLGFIGSAAYYVLNATTVVGGLIGILKAIFWPAFLVYGILKFLGM